MKTYIQKILDETITLAELYSDACKQELKNVGIAVKKVMKQISKILTGKHTVNLLEFYKEGNPLLRLSLGSNFKTVLAEAISDGVTVEIDETFFQHQNTEKVTDNDAIAELNEAVIDLTTASGRLEMCKRLGALAVLLKKQSTGQTGTLLNNGNATIIGWVKTSSGSVWRMFAGWRGDNWYCDAGDLGRWDAGKRFWSRNGETQ